MYRSDLKSAEYESNKKNFFWSTIRLFLWYQKDLLSAISVSVVDFGITQEISIWSSQILYQSITTTWSGALHWTQLPNRCIWLLNIWRAQCLRLKQLASWWTISTLWHTYRPNRASPWRNDGSLCCPPHVSLVRTLESSNVVQNALPRESTKRSPPANMVRVFSLSIFWLIEPLLSRLRRDLLAKTKVVLASKDISKECWIEFWIARWTCQRQRYRLVKLLYQISP